MSIPGLTWVSSRAERIGRRFYRAGLTVLVVALASTSDVAEGQPRATPPAGAIVLFDGRRGDMFVGMSGGPIDWPIEDGALVSTPNGRRSNNIVSRLRFRDAEIHVEFLLPTAGDGNSGVFLQGLYELQILESSGKAELTASDMGGVYSLFKPRVNAAREAGEWQAFDVCYRAPRRDTQGRITAKGAITAWLNGQKIHDRVKIGAAGSKYNPYEYDTTPFLREVWQRQQRHTTGPLILQDHDNPVRFRNIWVRPWDDRAFIDDGPEASRSEPAGTSRERTNK